MEQIAIIGMGCRFPGAANPQAFWRLMCNGVDAITEVPTDRFNIESVYDPRPATSGKMMSRWGGFLEQVDQFDAAFFGISPKEAARMDPQHRLLLEVAWEAMEDAGLVPEKLAGVNAGVFIGIITSDYWDRQFRNPLDLDVYSTAGSARSGAAGRISYALGLQGISVAVDAACSSSLVAVHLACQSLRTGSCRLALAGGVNIILNPDHTIGYSQGKMMAPDGRCKAFDIRANGYVRSEGAGVVVLKALSQALADGDPIYAVIRGSAVNNDGHSDFFMTPSVQGQRAVLRQAYRDAGVNPGQIGYVETHGTGTSVGDPVELKALGHVLAEDRSAQHPCIVGSVKTNIGHTEGAAGLAGLIKVVLCLKHGAIPPNLHFQTPNPAIPWQDLPLEVARTFRPWPRHDGPRLAGVSSFGIAGTNAHLVVQEAPPLVRVVSGGIYTLHDQPPAHHLLPLSAHSADALQEVAGRYSAFLAGIVGDDAPQDFCDVCYTASVCRTHHDHRLTIVSSSLQDASVRLEAFLHGTVDASVYSGRKIAGRTGKIAWVFPGQGSQWVGMGRDLLAREPVFRKVLEQCDRVMRRYVDWSLLEEFQATELQSHLEQIDVVQPMLFALQVALAALWRSWGMEPDAVVGHSMGEVAAAHVAGAISLDDAASIICGRSRLLLRTSGRGAMAVVELPFEQALLVVSDYADSVSIAVNNSPNSTVLSGDPQILTDILALLERGGVFGRLVKVNVASHSPQMDVLRSDLLALLKHVQPQSAVVPICSTVTGEMTDGSEFDAHYWVRNLREPVLFLSATQQLLHEGFDAFLELSPHPILVGAIKQTMQHEGRKGTVLASLRREEEGRTHLLSALGKLYTLGHDICWDKVYATGVQRVSLPTYPWQRERFWNSHLEEALLSPLQAVQTRRVGEAAPHPFLGQKLQSALQPGTYFWERELDTKHFPYLNDHRIQGAVLLPSTGFVEMALAAASEILGQQRYRLENIVLQKALFFPEKVAQTVQVILTPDKAGRACLHFFSLPTPQKRQADSWQHCASATICAEDDLPAVSAPEHPAFELILQEWKHSISATEHYQRLQASGIEHGPLFQGVECIWQGHGEVMARLLVPEAIAAEMTAYQVHPALFDSCLQAIMTFLPENAAEETYVPVAIEQVRLHRRPVASEQLWSHALIRSQTADELLEGDVFLIDEHGQVLLEVLGFRLQRLEGDGQASIERKMGQLLYAIDWEPVVGVAEGVQALQERKNWLIFSDSSGVGRHLVEDFQARGATCVVVTPGREFKCLHPLHYEVNPAHPAAFQLLLTEAFASQTCQGVIYLWGMNAQQAEMNTQHSLQDDMQHGCIGVLHLIQALAAAQWEILPRLWLVSAGVHIITAGDRATAVSQAPLWGLGRVIAYEHPDLQCTLVDIEATMEALPSLAVLAALSQEIYVGEHVDEVALRGKKRYLARLVRHTLPQPDIQQEKLLREDATYLITGGLGGIGLKVAQWLVGQGVRHLALMGRNGASAYAEEAIRAMEQAGATIRVIRADVAHTLQLADALTEIYHCMPPLRGIFHSAVVLDDSTLLQLDQERFLRIMRPKVEGAWNLHQLTQDQALDFFVMFSSAASLIGSPGQGNYAAANAFMDALAYYRKAQGYPALTINWGRWAEVGQATRGDRGERLDVRGFASMRPQDGLAILERLLRQQEPQIGAMSFNLYRWTRFYPALSQSSLFACLSQETIHSQHEEGESFTREALASLPIEQRTPTLTRYLSTQIASVLGLSTNKLDRQQQLTRFGIDSLMSVELKNRIASDFNIALPVATFLQGITLEDLAVRLLEHL